MRKSECLGIRFFMGFVAIDKAIFAGVQLLCLAANAFIKATRASTPAKGMAL